MKRSEKIGLCATCRHVEPIVSARGSTFYLCQLALTDPTFPKYPTLPVIECEGYEPSPERTRVQES